MNRKKTLLIAICINAGLLARLLIAALTTQEELPAPPSLAVEEPLRVPKFNEELNEPLITAVSEPFVPIELPLPVIEPEPVVHSLPPLAVAPAPVATPSTPLNEVVVKKGDNLEKIAKVHQTSVDEIIKVNQLPSSFLKIGQTLKIPTGGKKMQKVLDKKPVEMSPEYYTMKVGDNPWAVAMKHHMKLEELLRLNGLNDERARKLKPGSRLRIR